jgi:hypothetical protein
MFTEIVFEANETNKMINKKSEGDNHVTTSVTRQVNTQNVIPSESQRGSSKTLNVRDLFPLPQSQARVGIGPITSNVTKKNSEIST